MHQVHLLQMPLLTLSPATDSLTVSSPTSTLTANTVFGALRGLETFVQGFYTVKGVLMVRDCHLLHYSNSHHAMLILLPCAPRPPRLSFPTFLASTTVAL